MGFPSGFLSLFHQIHGLKHCSMMTDITFYDLRGFFFFHCCNVSCLGVCVPMHVYLLKGIQIIK